MDREGSALPTVTQRNQCYRIFSPVSFQNSAWATSSGPPADVPGEVRVLLPHPKPAPQALPDPRPWAAQPHPGLSPFAGKMIFYFIPSPSFGGGEADK